MPVNPRPRNPQPDYEAFLYQSINDAKSYHDQKERMAWLGLVLYAVMTAANNVGFANIEQVASQADGIPAPWRLGGYVLYCLLVFLVFVRFIMKQQRLRVLAASLVDASKMATLEMLASGTVPRKPSFDRTLGQADRTYSMLKLCPDCIYKHFDQVRQRPLHGLVWAQYGILLFVLLASILPVAFMVLTSTEVFPFSAAELKPHTGQACPAA
jgi:hypothetical protein